jgi:hypothetical protein
MKDLHVLVLFVVVLVLFVVGFPTANVNGEEKEVLALLNACNSFILFVVVSLTITTVVLLIIGIKQGRELNKEEKEVYNLPIKAVYEVTHYVRTDMKEMILSAGEYRHNYDSLVSEGVWIDVWVAAHKTGYKQYLILTVHGHATGTYSPS